MNKNDLAIELGLSLGTLTRYLSMGLPHEKTSGRYNFNLSEVEGWVADNIDSRQCEDRLPPITQKEAIAGLHRIAAFFLEHTDKNLVNLHLAGSCPLHHRKSGKGHGND